MLLNQLLALPIVKRKRLGNNHYCYIAILDGVQIGYTLDIANERFVCAYLPCADEDRMSRAIFANLALNGVDESRLPMYRVPKYLNAYKECKIWLDDRVVSNPVTCLSIILSDTEKGLEPEPEPMYDEESAWENFVSENDYYDSAWY